MKHALILLARIASTGALTCSLLLAQSPNAPPQSVPRPFVLDSTASRYPFALRLLGTFDVRGDEILVRVTEGYVVSAIPADLGAEGVASEVQIAVGIGRAIDSGWRIEVVSPPQEVASVLKPREKRSIPPLQFTITGVAGRPLEEQWLSAQLRVRQTLPGIPAGFLASYACAEENILGPTAGSLRRVGELRKNYSHVC